MQTPAALWASLTLAATLGFTAITGCEPDPPPGTEDLIQIEFIGGSKVSADGISQVQIRVKLPDGTQPKTVKLSTTAGTLSAAEVKTDPALATADFFLTADTKVQDVRLTAQVEEHTRYENLQFIRFCPNALNLLSTDAVVIANGNNSTELTATVLRTDRAGTPSQGLEILYGVKRKDENLQKTTGTLSVVTTPLTNAAGQVKLRLRAGQDAGTMIVWARYSCALEDNTTVDASHSLEILYVPPATP